MFPYCCLLIICIMLFPCSVFKVHHFGCTEMILSASQQVHLRFRFDFLLSAPVYISTTEERIIRLASLAVQSLNEIPFWKLHSTIEKVVGQSGLEPPTSRLSVVCSSQLSYWPILVEVIGLEPMTPCLQSRRSPS